MRQLNRLLAMLLAWCVESVIADIDSAADSPITRLPVNRSGFQFTIQLTAANVKHSVVVDTGHLSNPHSM
jgi:hypothetical protein